jgi:hypothetical protein
MSYKNNLFKPLVFPRVGHKANSLESTPIKIEAAFRIPGYRGLWQDTADWSMDAANFYTSRSARTPENLLNHVQRIIHHIRRKNTEDTYGAILDLFIVLKNHGRPLRERMLNYARPLLLGDRFDRLQQLLDKNLIVESAEIPESPRSVLSRGFVSPFRLVEKVNTDEALDSDPLSVSRSYMEYGQLDAARSVLETEVLNGSDNPEIHSDLIEIYRRSNDKINFQKIYPLLQIDQESLSLLWQGLDEFFASIDT